MPWERSPVPKERQVRGLGPIVISVPTLTPTDSLLTRVFNMRLARDYPHPDNPATRVHVMEPKGFNDAQEVGDRVKANQARYQAANER